MPLTADRAPASRILKERRDAIAGRATSLYFETHPELEQHWEGAPLKCTEDNKRHLDYLREAVAVEQPALFTEYAAWAATQQARLNIPGEALASNLVLLKEVLRSELEGAGAAAALTYLDAAIARINGGGRELPPCYIEGTGTLGLLARAYLAALLRGERHTASRLILAAAEAGTPIKDIYVHVFQRSLYEIGRLWQINEITVAQEHYCTGSTQLIMSQLYPYIFAGERTRGTYVGTCIAGELHEIGGRMIADFFEMAGWNAYYLGANNPSDGVVQTLMERKADILGISATITYHVEQVAELIQQVRSEAACAEVKIMVGGYPFNLAPDLWREVHADGTACDPDSVIALAEALTGKRATPSR